MCSNVVPDKVDAAIRSTIIQLTCEISMNYNSRIHRVFLNPLHNSSTEEATRGPFVPTLSSPVSITLLCYIRGVPGEEML